MKLSQIMAALEAVAPVAMQESYDNSGLIVGHPGQEVHRALLSLDSTEEVIAEAIREGCDLVISHHPIVFKGLKRLNGSNYVERAVMMAVKHNIALYACHTNLDNVLQGGVNEKIAEKLGLKGLKVLNPMGGMLKKLVVFVPPAQAGAVRQALFDAGAGHIGQYSECSFSLDGRGTFRAGEGANPFVGKTGERHTEAEERVEVVLPAFRVSKALQAMLQAHPYEEVAWDLYALENRWNSAGSGILGHLPEPMKPQDFLAYLKECMELPLVRHTHCGYERVETVAVCGGAGSFLTAAALQSGAQAFVTADVKYHEFFDAENQLMLCDIGHYESEKYTLEIFARILSENFPNFATIFAKTISNPVNYYY